MYTSVSSNCVYVCLYMFIIFFGPADYMSHVHVWLIDVQRTLWDLRYGDWSSYYFPWFAGDIAARDLPRVLSWPVLSCLWFGCLGVSPRGLGWLHSLGFRMASPAWRGFIRQHFSQQIRQVGYGDFYPETLAGYIVVSMLTFVSVPPACKQAALRPKRRFNQHGKLESEGKK